MTEMLVPFANDKSMKFGGVTIENGPDCVSVYGSADYTMDQVGLSAARSMKALLDVIVARLESEPSLPSVLPVAATGRVKNPFG